MGVKDKIGTIMKNIGSKRTENSDIKLIEEQIEEQKDVINKAIADIGEYYWNLYSSNRFIPERESLPLFATVKGSLAKIDELKELIEDAKKSGNEERLKNKKDLEAKEKHDAEERQRMKEEQAKQKEEQARQKELLAKQKAEEQAKQKEEQARQKELFAKQKAEEKAKQKAEEQAKEKPKDETKN